MEIDDKNLEQNSAPFNMALDTLKRLSDIFREFTQISMDLTIPDNLRQSKKISLVKSFFLNAAPLLQEDKVREFQPQVFSLKCKEVKVVSRTEGKEDKVSGFRIMFDQELNDKVDNLILEISLALQKEKYFMPPKTDPRFGWKMG